jgi:putative transposase
MKSKNRYRKYRFYIRHDRHSVSLLSNHTVFTTKYRMPLLTPEIAERCEQIIRQIARDLNIRIIRMAVNSDHVHIFYIYPPKLSPSVIVKKFKNYSSLNLRREFPELKKKVKKHLWAPSNWHSSVGIGFEVVENYIRGQEGNDNGD